MDAFAKSLFNFGAEMARAQFGGQNRIDKAIEAGTKACEIAEQNARDRSNERGNSIVISSHNFPQKLAMRLTEMRCDKWRTVGYTTEDQVECKLPAYAFCEHCGPLCVDCLTADCDVPTGHVITERL